MSLVASLNLTPVQLLDMSASHFDDLSYAEIAAKRGVSAHAVKVSCYRARRRAKAAGIVIPTLRRRRVSRPVESLALA